MPLQPDEFVDLRGKKHPLYRGVLREAHANGLIGLEVSVIQPPSEANGQSAICQAIATFSGPDGRERIFTEIGDCDTKNAGPMIVPHKIRMAATRAKGRALRDALGIGEALAEEMSEPEDAPASVRQSPPVRYEAHIYKPQEGPQSARTASAVDSTDILATEEFYCSQEGCHKLLAQKEIWISRKYGIPMSCRAHGRALVENKIAASPAV